VSRATNFYYSFLVLPPAKRDAIVAVWDFCRAVDDAVDEAQAEDVAGQVAMWRREVAACFEGGTPATAQGRALAPLVQTFNLPRHAFDALVDGVAMDVGSRRYETFDELYEYCIRVASAVGLVCVEVFGYSNPRAKEYATELGVALQLTNILRDVPTDLALGRVYLPQEDLRRFNCTDEALRRGVVTEPVRALLAFEIARAREYFHRAAVVLPRSDARRLVAAEIMGAIYQDILRRIEAQHYDVFSAVIRVPRPARFLIALTTWARTLAGLRLPVAQGLGIRD
jgi:15-cis-phytoene synthase